MSVFNTLGTPEGQEFLVRVQIHAIGMWAEEYAEHHKENGFDREEVKKVLADVKGAVETANQILKIELVESVPEVEEHFEIEKAQTAEKVI